MEEAGRETESHGGLFRAALESRGWLGGRKGVIKGARPAKPGRWDCRVQRGF